MENTSSDDTARSPAYLVFFDLDRTITGAISGKVMAEEGFRKGLLSSGKLINAIFISTAFRLKILDPHKVAGKMVDWVRGIKEERMNELCKEVSHSILIPSIYKEAIKEIEFHRDKNARIIILSSAVRAICSELAMHLGIDDIQCTELEAIGGILTGRTVGSLCFGEEKAVRLLSYCKQYNSNPSDVWYYGDSGSDIPALMLAGHAVCVNPDLKLRRTGHKYNWKIVSWKS